MWLQPRTQPSQIALWNCKGPWKISQTASYWGRGLGDFFSFPISQWVAAGCSWGGASSWAWQLSSTLATVGERKFWGAHTAALTTVHCLCCSDPVALYKFKNLGATLLGFWLRENLKKKKSSTVPVITIGLGAMSDIHQPSYSILDSWYPWLATLVI